MASNGMFLVLQVNMSKEMDVGEVSLTSVGVDIGTTTSHIILSELTLTRLFTKSGPRFVVTKRKVLYRGRIILTPLNPDNTIAVDPLVEMLHEEFRNAGISPNEIDTGAVIITGESAKKDNAELIVNKLSKEAGKFVAASAGPNFESFIAARGSGAVDYSEENELTVLNCDIGGGTSNIALVENGRILATSCINVGARLVATNSDGEIVRLESPILPIAKKLGLDLKIGGTLSNESKKKLAEELGKALFEALRSSIQSEIASGLMMTELTPEAPVDAIMFSGGVSEYIYGHGDTDFGDLGPYLAQYINEHKEELHAPVVEATESIRATVIGAGQYTLQVSGVTTHVDTSKLPLHNVPVIAPRFPKDQMSKENIVNAIRNAYGRFDLDPTKDLAAMYFEGAIGGSYKTLSDFSSAVIAGVQGPKQNGIPLIMIFEKDIANSVGNVMSRETEQRSNIISIDELAVEEGDFIDIGLPRAGGQMVPVVIKSLVFEKRGDKDASKSKQ